MKRSSPKHALCRGAVIQIVILFISAWWTILLLSGTIEERSVERERENPTRTLVPLRARVAAPTVPPRRRPLCRATLSSPCHAAPPPPLSDRVAGFSAPLRWPTSHYTPRCRLSRGAGHLPLFSPEPGPPLSTGVAPP